MPTRCSHRARGTRSHRSIHGGPPLGGKRSSRPGRMARDAAQAERSARCTSFFVVLWGRARVGVGGNRRAEHMTSMSDLASRNDGDEMARSPRIAIYTAYIKFTNSFLRN